MLCIAKPLEMYYLALTKKFYYLVYIGVIRQTQNVVIGCACFLLRRKIFRKVRYWVCLYLKIRRRKRYTRGIYRIYAVAVVNIVISLAVLIKALGAFAIGKLSYNTTDDFQMCQFVSSDMVSVDLLLFIVV